MSKRLFECKNQCIPNTHKKDCFNRENNVHQQKYSS